MTSLTGATVRYRSLQAGDEQGVLRLMRACGYAPDERSWSWINRECPQGETLVEVAVSEEGEIIGHYGILPRLLQCNGVNLRVGMAIHAAIHPDHRGLSVLQNLMRRVMLHCREAGIPFIYAFPNDRVWLVYLKFFQWQKLEELKALELSLGGWQEPKPNGAESSRWILRDPPVFEEAHGRIQLAMLQGSFLQGKVSAVKDRAWFDWRYTRHPKIRYQLLEDRSAAGELSGYLVLKQYEQSGVRYGHFVDLGMDPSAVGGFPALVRSAIRLFRRQGVHVASCWLPDGIPLTGALQQMGFRRTGFVTHMGIRPIEPHPEEAALLSNQWHVTMGDSDAF